MQNQVPVCCGTEALGLIAAFLLAFTLWIWLKNTASLAGWLSIWEAASLF